MPTSVASGATSKTSRAPAMTRAKTSRPSVSVPNQWPEPGETRMSADCSRGSCGATASPKSAQKTQNPTIRTPATNVFERSSTRSVSARAVAVLAAATSGVTSALTRRRRSGCGD